MDFEFDYFASGLQMALTVVALSLILLVNLSRPITSLFIAGIPFLLGYTAYISSEEFRRESLASLIGIMFIPLGGLVAASAASIIIFIFWYHPSHLENHSEITTLPLHSPYLSQAF
ncbi:hypothetical protein HRED_02615 [Candidatus Haloredivivus sp. G17]|nr:hypothetical protein HRED_02615 [Candidatus Haloredivivus sp. G17]